jgi:hypothetical protein
VPRTLDAPVLHATFVQRAASVRAPVSDREDLAA